jgi:hypothetical protein
MSSGATSILTRFDLHLRVMGEHFVTWIGWSARKSLASQREDASRAATRSKFSNLDETMSIAKCGASTVVDTGAFDKCDETIRRRVKS